MQAALWKSSENQKDFPWLEIIGNSFTFASWIISPNILLHIPQLNSFSCLHANSFVKVFRKSKGFSLTWDYRKFIYICFLNGKSQYLVAYTRAKRFFMSSCFMSSCLHSMRWRHMSKDTVCDHVSVCSLLKVIQDGNIYMNTSCFKISLVQCLLQSK